MTPSEILAELEKLAARLGVIVRFEAIDARNGGSGKGGLCRVRGEPHILVEERLGVLDKIGVLSDGLATLDLTAIYLPPVLRARLQKRGKGRVRPPLKPPAKARARGAPRGAR